MFWLYHYIGRIIVKQQHIPKKKKMMRFEFSPLGSERSGGGGEEKQEKK